METQKHSKEQQAKMVANIWVNLNENNKNDIYLKLQKYDNI